MVFTQNMGNKNDDQTRIIELEKRPRWDFGKRKFISVGINKGNSSRLLNRGTSASEEPGTPSSPGNTYGGHSSLNMRAANKQWVHPPEALLRGHIVYNVKFLGECEVDNPKGTDVVKEAIRKRKFNKHIKKAEGQKTPKVELTISADGVTIQDPKSKMIMHQYALHRISYCADDKSDKRMFTFIAKAGDTNIHNCYVFDSEKCAEEITLTIGQAFDLAYRKFLDTSGRDFDLKKQYLMLQKKVQTLEKENLTLRLRVQELEKQKEMEENQKNQQIYAQGDPDTSNGDLTGIEPMISDAAVLNTSLEHSAILTLDSPASFGEESTTDEPEYSTPKAKQTSVGRRLENLLFEADSQPHTNGVTSPNGQASGLLSPPPPPARSRTSSTPVSLQHQTTPTQAANSQTGATDMFGSTPFVTPSSPGGAAAEDPFGMGSFTPNASMDIDRQIMKMDKDFLDLQDGFTQGLSFGTEDFSLADLDPLSSK